MFELTDIKKLLCNEEVIPDKLISNIKIETN